MVNQKVLRYGRERSCIRELFEYGRRQAAIVGSENVFDFSLGNPSVPPPSEVNDAIREILENDPPLKAHGYTSAVGADDTREAIAAALTERLGRPFTKRNYASPAVRRRRSCPRSMPFTGAGTARQCA